MDRVQVDSSAMKEVGYDEASQTMEIQFPNGYVYEYTVAPELYRGLLNAPSQGKYYAAFIKGRHGERRIR